MTLTLSELFTEIGKSAEPAKVLLKYGNRVPALKQVLWYAYSGKAEFDTPIPQYNVTNTLIPDGFGYSQLQTEARRLYIFTKQYNKVDAKRKVQLLTQILEALDNNEAKLLEDLIQGKFEVPGVTKELIAETFPGLLEKTSV